jgi:hypothetical protein
MASGAWVNFFDGRAAASRISSAALKRWLQWGALVLNLGLAASYVGLWVRRAPETPRQRNDFSAFYTAWTLVRGHRADALYDFEAQARQQAALLGDRSGAGGLLPFLNPPPVALVFAPLARLSLPRAFTLWTVGQLALLGWLLRQLLRLTRGRPARDRALVCVAVLAAPPLLLTFETGAFSLLIVVALLNARAALVDGRDATAGLWLAVAAAKPQLVLTSVVGALAGRRWRTLAAALIAATLLGLVVTIALGWAVWPGFVRALLAVHRSFERFAILPAAMYNLEGSLFFAFGPAARSWAPPAALGGLVLGCLLTAWIWRGPWRPGVPRFELQLAATLLVGMFFSLHLYWQDGLLLVVAGVLFESYLVRSGRPRTIFTASALVAPAIWFVSELLLPQSRPVRTPVLMTLLLGAAIWRELRASRDAPPTERSPG